jgi:hypothetical protein
MKDRNGSKPVGSSNQKRKLNPQQAKAKKMQEKIMAGLSPKEKAEFMVDSFRESIETHQILDQEREQSSTELRKELWDLILAEVPMTLGYTSTRAFFIKEIDYSYPYLSRQILAAKQEVSWGLDVGTIAEGIIREVAQANTATKLKDQVIAVARKLADGKEIDSIIIKQAISQVLPDDDDWGIDWDEDAETDDQVDGEDTSTEGDDSGDNKPKPPTTKGGAKKVKGKRRKKSTVSTDPFDLENISTSETKRIKNKYDQYGQRITALILRNMLTEVLSARQS